MRSREIRTGVQFKETDLPPHMTRYISSQCIEVTTSEEASLLKQVLQFTARRGNATQAGSSRQACKAEHGLRSSSSNGISSTREGPRNSSSARASSLVKGRAIQAAMGYPALETGPRNSGRARIFKPGQGSRSSEAKGHLQLIKGPAVRAAKVAVRDEILRQTEPQELARPLKNRERERKKKFEA